MKIEMQLQGLEGTMEALRALPAELVSQRGGPVAAALRKAAREVILKQELANLESVTAATTDGERRLSTGFLKQNVVVSRGKQPPGSKGEKYLVRVRRKGYPNRSTGKGKKLAGVTTLKTAQLLEYGSSQQPAEPWIRPAVASRGREALQMIETEIVAGIDRAWKKLAPAAPAR